MKHKVILLPCLFIISLIALHFFAPATIRASEPPIIGVLHSEAYPYATMMKNSFENSPYGTSGAMRMMWFCRGNNIDLRAIEPYHKERLSADYFNRVVARMKKDPPDVIYKEYND